MHIVFFFQLWLVKMKIDTRFMHSKNTKKSKLDKESQG